MAACGLDFGTSNTTLGAAGPEGPTLLPLEGAHRTIPSAIFFELGEEPVIGRAATEAYVEGRSGRLMRGLKSVLGTPSDGRGNPGRPAAHAAARHHRPLPHGREGAGRGRLRQSLDSVVHGRPVHFVDGDPEADRRAEDTLAPSRATSGSGPSSFQYEPIAAALDYERQVRSEEIALVADIGGGTSDFSIVRLSPERRGQADRAGDILANDGVRIGGTDFDRQLSLGTVMPLLGLGSPMRRGDLAVPNAYFHDLATWSAINRLYNAKTLREIDEVIRDCARPELVARLREAVEGERGHALAGAVEGAKIAASDHAATLLDLSLVERGLAVPVDRGTLAAQTDDLARAVAARIGRCLAQADLAPERIDALFLTGGSTGLPHLRAALTAALPAARVVEGDTFGSVGLGLTIEAARRAA